MSNYIRNQLTRQVTNNAGTIQVTNNQGGYQYTNNNGQVVPGPGVSTTYLSDPPRVSDPKISAAAVNAAIGQVINNNLPELAQNLADVAAYVSVINNVSPDVLFSNGQPNVQLLSGYNTFKPKSSQLGMFDINLSPPWQSNPVYQGTLLLTQ